MAIRWSGTNNQRALGTYALPMTQLSMCCWMKVPANPGVVIATYFWDSNTGDEVDLEIDSGTLLEIDAPNNTTVSTIKSLQVGAWHFVGFTVNGSAITAFASAPGGGDLTVVTGSVTWSTSSFTNLSVGDFKTAGNNPWVGSLENILVWSGNVLSINEMMNQQGQKVPVDTNGLFAWYPLDNLADFKTDYSGNGNHLVPGSAAVFGDKGAPVGWA